MDHRNLYGVAAILLSGAIFVHSLTSANALPTYPTGTSYNEFPYESIQCDGCVSSTPFLTVPSDKYFILTSASEHPNYVCSIYVDGQDVNYNKLFGGFLSGDARLVVPSNSTISTASYNCYIEGYYAEPNGINLESLYGEVAAGSTDTLLSVPSDKNFIITAASMSAPNVAHLYSDSDLVLHSGQNGYNSGLPHIFSRGKAHLKIPAGTELKIENKETTISIRYYIQSYYAPL